MEAINEFVNLYQINQISEMLSNFLVGYNNFYARLDAKREVINDAELNCRQDEF